MFSVRTITTRWDKERWFIKLRSKRDDIDNRAVRQQDGGKTEDGRMTKKCRARPGIHSLARHFFVILPSSVFPPSCCVRSLIVATFKLEYEDDYEHEFTVLSKRLRFGGRQFLKCACSDLKTRPRSPRTSIRRSLISKRRRWWWRWWIQTRGCRPSLY